VVVQRAVEVLSAPRDELLDDGVVAEGLPQRALVRPLAPRYEPDSFRLVDVVPGVGVDVIAREEIVPRFDDDLVRPVLHRGELPGVRVGHPRLGCCPGESQPVVGVPERFEVRRR
jgi:hypothetical protein